MIDWRHWHNEPLLIGGLVLLGWAYALLVGPLRRQLSVDTPFPRAHAYRFYGSLLVFYLAVGSPLDQIGERFLLTAHMVQHQLLIFVAAPLFLLGLPSWLFTRALRSPRALKVARFITRPMICAVIYTVVLSIWHAPDLYDWALRNKGVHVIEHLMFFGAALFYWWPLLSPAEELPRASYPGQMFYLISVTIGMTPVFALIAFSDNILYPTYEYAPRLIASLSADDDQLLGAAVMKMGGMAVTFIMLSVAFYQWYRSKHEPAEPVWTDVRPQETGRPA